MNGAGGTRGRGITSRGHPFRRFRGSGASPLCGRGLADVRGLVVLACFTLLAVLPLCQASGATPTPTPTPTADVAPERPSTPAPVPRPHLVLTATLDDDGAHIHGRVRMNIPNATAHPERTVRLSLFPNHLAQRPQALGEVAFHWLYPRGFSPAAIRLGTVRITAEPPSPTPTPTPVAPESAPVSVRLDPSSAGPQTIATLTLPTAVAPGAAADIEVVFSTTLPDRLGNFGCQALACRLMGGFYPSPLGFSEHQPAAATPPGRASADGPEPAPLLDISATIRAPLAQFPVSGGPSRRAAPAPAGATGLEVFLDGERRAPGSPTIQVDAEAVPYVTLVTGGPWRGDDVAVAGWRASYFHREPRPPSSAGEVLPYVREDRAGLILQTVERALGFLERRGLAPPAAPGTPEPPLVLIQAPLRHELVHVHDHVILVSDRMFEIFPVESLRRYHALELIRAVFTAAADRLVAPFETDRDRSLTAELLGTALTEEYSDRAFHNLKFAREWLRPLAFIPAVDQLLYAPVVASSSSYFGELGVRSEIRDDVRQLDNRPDGKLIASKLQDLLGSAAFSRMVEAMLVGRLPLREAALREAARRQAAAGIAGPADLAWFWRQWLDGPSVPPQVNYRISAVRFDAATSSATVDVERQGDPVREPVELRVTDRAGGVHDLVWPADAQAVHRFVLHLPAGLDAVELDPRHRLVESPVGTLTAADDPLVDDRVPRRLRLVYNGFGALVDATAVDASFAAAVTVKPQHDLRNALLVVAQHSPALLVGTEASYERWFGAKANPNRLTTAAGIGLGVARLDPHFGVPAGAPAEPGWRLSASLFAEHDDRAYLIDPWRAVGLQAALGYALTALDGGQRLSQATGELEVLRLLELAPGQVLALDLDLAATLGDLRRRSQLLPLGGPAGLRGYGLDELLGRGRVLVRIELRNRYVSDLDWNILHFTSVRGFGGTVFVEAGAVSSCADLAPRDAGLFWDVGYSLRVFHDAFGVYQQMLSVDLAVPLARRDRNCLGGPTSTAARAHPLPFVVLLSFLPNF